MTQGWAWFHHHCLVMSSLAGSASTSTAQPQSRAWPIKCQMPWLWKKLLALTTFYNALKVSKIPPCQACKLCLWRMELGSHLPATALFSLILPCFLVIFVGNGYYELFGLSAHLSLIIRTLPKRSSPYFSSLLLNTCALPVSAHPHCEAWPSRMQIGRNEFQSAGGSV